MRRRPCAKSAGADAALCNTHALTGTRLGDSCQPTTSQHFFNTLYAAVPSVGRPITLQLVSKTAFAAFAAANGAWQVSLMPAQGAAVQLGSMQQWHNTSTDYVWRLVVPGSFITSVSRLP